MSSVLESIYEAGGGRTLRANATKNFLAEAGATWIANTGVNGTRCRLAVAVGAAVWAAAQTVHFADSVPFEW